VARWRKSLGVTRMDSEGSRRLILAASERGLSRIRGQPVPLSVSATLRRIAIEKDFAAKFMRRWTAEEEALLGTDSDQAVAALLGRTRDEVRLKRTRLGIVAVRDLSRAAG
jgi:hypothetical protein